jgi:multidrug efflux system membrane fusion protein
VVRAVKLGVTEGERVAVTQGVQAGERVVLEGLDRLRDGRDVDIIADPPVAAK